MGIGADVQAGIPGASGRPESGRPEARAETTSERHAEILDQPGVHHVIRSAHDGAAGAAS